ncbi:MAG: hypothetical protein L0Y75_02925, partial [Acidobacteria bacterium]|nr:hypothetical protein [Acidobacteriota bacterium]
GLILKDYYSTLSIFDLPVDFIGFGRSAARQPNPMKSTGKSKMDKVESVCSVFSVISLRLGVAGATIKCRPTRRNFSDAPNRVIFATLMGNKNQQGEKDSICFLKARKD